MERRIETVPRVDVKVTGSVIGDGETLPRGIEGTLRTFPSGATKDSDSGKLDPEGFLSPRVLLVFSQYMHRHRAQGGSLRASDNWQRGIDRSVHMKSLVRHFLDVWLMHDGDMAWSTEIRGRNDDEALLDALCGMFFGVAGYIFELTRPPTKNPGE